VTNAAKFRVAALGTLVAVFLGACGGGGSSHQNTIAGSASNVQTITVNSGPAGNYANGVFTSVMVCVPSTSNCQTIDGILVDTGSYGLRLLSSALTLTLPDQTGSDGNPIGECAGFVSAFTSGPVATADITISGEKASALPVQVIDGTFADLASKCAAALGTQEQDTLTGQNGQGGLGANGILGIGPLVQDCGSQCAQTGSSNPGLYYDCAGSSCTVTTEALAQQVQNPVASFATDNNGVIVELPSVPNPTVSSTGSLVFGIGTQSNNALSNATVYPINSSVEFSTGFNGQTYPAFVDSGSNAYFFLDSGTTSLPQCPDPNASFYCPSSNTNLSAAPASTGSGSETVKFTIGNADSIFSGPTAAVFPTLGGPNPGTFDWGLPFFFGRNVYVAIVGKTTPGGPGPYWAF
jgi:hypothetical protein